ncbi:MAG: TIGR00180 family glycosyltransferase [Candidatus Yanofskybacteria bacterium]|nr:TIGR00180 family glycosyltransferase [Candidatus Yanofskybacteria bacterium]
MDNLNKNLNVAILISTKDRPDFMTRQLLYYSKLKSPHPVYIADSSNDKNAEILKNAVNKLKNEISIKYTWYPPGPDNHGSLLEQVKEKYACVISDDDYQIPASLVKCAEFLENNPDYAAAGGRSVSFRLKESGPYGELQRLADYPRYSIEAETARQRLIDFMKVIYSISFFVNRVDGMKKAWKSKLYMAQTMNELISWNHLIIAGKSKLIDCLSLVRQIHAQQYSMPNIFDWVTGKNFSDDYEFFKDDIAKAVAEKDNIDVQDAKETAKEIFWHYAQKTLSSDYKYYIAKQYPPKKMSNKNLRAEIAKSFPVLKKIYRSYVRRLLSNDPQMHYEVLQPSSKYYRDFKPVMDSFTGSSPKNL